MPQPANDSFPNLASVPCGSDPEVRRLMTNAAPCRCGGCNLMPVSDAQMPPVFAVACDDCGEIEGDAPNLARRHKLERMDNRGGSLNDFQFTMMTSAVSARL